MYYICMYVLCMFGSVVAVAFTVSLCFYGKNCVCAYAYCTIPQWLVDWLTD